jgi:hypothetical protein
VGFEKGWGATVSNHGCGGSLVESSAAQTDIVGLVLRHLCGDHVDLLLIERMPIGIAQLVGIVDDSWR